MASVLPVTTPITVIILLMTVFTVLSLWQSSLSSCDECRLSANRLSALKPSQPTGTVSLKQCSQCARHRTMSSGVAVTDHTDLTYRMMLYVAATTLMLKLNLVQLLRQLSHDVVRHRATMHGNLHVKVAGRHRTTPDDIVRCRPTSCVKASSPVVRCRAQCEHRIRLCKPRQLVSTQNCQ